MNKTTISISKDLRNKIRHSKHVTFSGSYENFLNDLMERDKRYTNEEKRHINLKNWKQEARA